MFVRYALGFLSAAAIGLVVFSTQPSAQRDALLGALAPVSSSSVPPAGYYLVSCGNGAPTCAPSDGAGEYASHQDCITDAVNFRCASSSSETFGYNLTTCGAGAPTCVPAAAGTIGEYTSFQDCYEDAVNFRCASSSSSSSSCLGFGANCLLSPSGCCGGPTPLSCQLSGTEFRCLPVPACQPNGTGCFFDSDCCGGLCSGGVCAGPVACTGDSQCGAGGCCVGGTCQSCGGSTSATTSVTPVSSGSPTSGGSTSSVGSSTSASGPGSSSAVSPSSAAVSSAHSVPSSQAGSSASGGNPSSAPGPSSASASSASSQCPMVCTGGSPLIQFVSLGFFGAPTCTIPATCGGGSSSSAGTVSSAVSVPSSGASSAIVSSAASSAVSSSFVSSSGAGSQSSGVASPGSSSPAVSSSSHSASSANLQVCCLYDRSFLTTGEWNVQSCELRHKTPLSTVCHNIVGEPDSWGEWREDIPKEQCTPSNALDVCGKPPADLSVTKTIASLDRPDAPGESGTVTYTITVSNGSDAGPAVDVRLVDSGGPYLAFVSASDTGCESRTIGANAGTSCDIGILPPGVSHTITLTFAIKPFTGPGCPAVTNLAIAFADNPDPDTSDNDGSASFDAYCSGEGSSQSAASSSATSQLGACCLKVGFSGNNDKRCKGVSTETACTALIGTKVTLDSGLQYTVQDVAWKPALQCSAELCPPLFEEKPCCSPTNACAKKEVHECESEGGRPMDANSCSTVVCVPSSSSASSAASSSSQAPDLRVTKALASGPGPYEPGQTVTYDVVVANTGPETATANLSEFIPPGLTPAGMPSGCIGVGNSLIQCTGVEIPPGGRTFTFSFTADNPKGCTNDRTIGLNKAYVVAVNPKHDTNTLNNIGEAGGVVVKCPTWEVNKELLSTGPFRPGDTVQFKITYTRKLGPYEHSAGDILPKDYAIDRLVHLEMTDAPESCSVTPTATAGLQMLVCGFPPTSKNGTVTHAISAVVKDSACPSGSFSNGASANRGTTTQHLQVLHQDIVSGTVDCSNSSAASSAVSSASSVSGPAYCCTIGNRCVEKTAGVSCENGATPGTDPLCGGACVPKFCCPTGAVSCNQQVTGTGQCPSPKAGTAAGGYTEQAACDTACALQAPTGACCTAGSCQAGKTASECTALGGEWNEGKTCEDVNQCQEPEEEEVYCCAQPDGAEKHSCLLYEKKDASSCPPSAVGAANGYETLDGCQEVPECVPEPTETAGCCIDDLDGLTRSCSATITTSEECAARAGQNPEWFADSCSTKCTTEVTACAPGCYPAGPGGVCPIVITQQPTSWWSRFVAFLTGAPLTAQLELIEGTTCCCPPGGGTTGATGGTGGIGGTGGSSSSAPAKQCGVCPAAASQTECSAAPNRCVWDGSPFAFLTVLFGGTGGTCEPAPECSLPVGSSSSAGGQQSSTGGGVSSAGGESSVGGGASSVGGQSSSGDASSAGERSSASVSGGSESASSRSSDGSSSSSSSSSDLILTLFGVEFPYQCGDRIVHAERGEQCEPGAENADGARRCTAACVWAVCPPGKTEWSDGTCVDLPACPSGPVAANPTSLHLHCVNACSGSPDSGKCTAACVCGCRPGAFPKAGEAAGSCVSSCLEGGNAAAACAGRTEGDELTQCCMNSCIGFACPLL